MKYRFILIVIALCISSMQARGQVTIAPPLLTIERENPFGSFIVINRSNVPQEVSISFRYGYPASDEEGNLYLHYVDEPDSTMYSAAEWIRAFPRRFILEPMEEQTVRLSVRPPRDIADGTYTARIITSSQQVNYRVENSGVGVAAAINFQFNQVSALMYRHGEISTGIEITNIEMTQDSDLVTLLAHLRRTGNSPYLGLLTLRVFDETGSLVEERDHSIAVYNELTRSFRFERSTLPSGQYTVEFNLSTERRSDVPQSVLIHVPDVTKTFTFSTR